MPNYTEEEDKALREHFQKGWSASKSAAMITANFGIFRSRNAIIGRRMRLGLVRGLSPAQAGRESLLRANRRFEPKPTPIAILLAEDFPEATIIELAEAVASDKGNVRRQLEAHGLSRPEGEIKDFGKIDGEPTPSRKRVAEMRASLMSEAA